MDDDFEAPENTESQASRKRRAIGLVIAVIAGILAIVSYLSNENDLDQILTHVAANNQTALSHAGKDRCAQLRMELDYYEIQFDRYSADDRIRVGKLQDRYKAEIAHLEEDNNKIQSQADELVEQSHNLADKDTALDISKVALQLAVVLCSITVLTEHRIFTYVGIGLTVVGLVVALWAVLVMD